MKGTVRIIHKEHPMDYLSAKVTAAAMIFNSRLQSAATDETGDGPTDNAVIIAGGVAAGVTLVGLITAAVAKYAHF